MHKFGMKIIFGAIILAVIWVFLSFRITEVPPGITADEAAFGYNGALISKTGHDENGRFMPIFALSLHGKDWRQPVTQYSDALAFKIFGSSYQTLREVSVFFALVSLMLIVILLYKMEGWFLALSGGLIFLTTPLLVIQSHLGLDNIAPVPLVILWLVGLYLFEKTHKLKYLVLAGFTLGLSFYSYKAMRLIVPVWSILTVGYLFYLAKFNWKDRLFKKSTLAFILGGLPFLLVIPILQLKYHGAVFDSQKPSFDSYQTFFNGYFSNLDPSFLFVTGDSTLYHSTGKHGALLLATLPLFLIGAYQSIKKRNFFLFALIAFISGPILFSTVNSLYRASRLLAMIPPYTLVTAYGTLIARQAKNKFKTYLLAGCFILIALNFGDFINYYWYTYPEFARHYFQNNSSSSYLEFARQAKLRNLQPYIEEDLYKSDDIVAQFYEAAYFNQKFIFWHSGENLPENGILMTNQDNIPGTKNLNANMPVYQLQVFKPL